MTKEDKELNTLRNENARLRDEVAELRTRVAALQMDITRWEHCHRQDMEDNLRLKNQLALTLVERLDATDRGNGGFGSTGR